MVIILIILAGIAALFAAEDFLEKPWKEGWTTENRLAHRLDEIVCMLFAIFLLLLAGLIKLNAFG